VQTKPTVRNTKVSEYQLFVKEHFQRVKKENFGTPHGGIMEILGREYREQKAKGAAVAGLDGSADVDEMVKVMEVITLDD
jgi:hypothetical protein